MVKLGSTQFNVEFRGPSPYDLLRSLVMKNSLQDEQEVYSGHVQGYTSNGEAVRSVLKTETARMLYISEDLEGSLYEVYLLKHFHEYMEGYLQIVYTDNHIDVEAIGNDTQSVQNILRDIRTHLSEAPVRGTVHMLALEQSYYLTQLGEVEHPLERGNYTPEVLDQYDRVLSDLLSEIPEGRLTLLNGEPGTGKSFLIRGLISAAKGLFIYIPASVAGSITGPDIIPVLLREKDKDMPIILLMEDADSSLATRQLDNVSRLSDLLNMSDGILGDMSDLRILATTNSKKDDIDKAVRRPGRLNEYIQLDPLDYAHAHAIFARLLGHPHPLKDSGTSFPRCSSLAEVYKEARKYGWKPQVSPKRNMKRRFEFPSGLLHDYGP